MGKQGVVLREYFLDQFGPFVSQLIASPAIQAWTPYGSDTLSSLQSRSWVPGEPERTQDWANSFGEVIMGFIKPPLDGAYTFWVSGDNQTQFYLGTDEQFAPVRARVMSQARATADTFDYTGPEEFTKNQTQQSEPVQLLANKYYYFEIWHMEDFGRTHAQVRWAKPGEVLSPEYAEVVPGSVLYFPVFPSGDCSPR